MRRWIIERALEHYESDDAYDAAERMIKDNAEVEAEAIRIITKIIEDIRNGK